MASKRNVRRRSCGTKKRYESLGEAKRVVAILIRRGTDARIVAYHCKFCKKYHYGHNGVPL